jgi:hypothetical protein
LRIPFNRVRCGARQREKLKEFVQELYLLRTVCLTRAKPRAGAAAWRLPMGGLIYLIGLIVVIMAVLSLLGLR